MRILKFLLNLSVIAILLTVQGLAQNRKSSPLVAPTAKTAAAKDAAAKTAKTKDAAAKLTKTTTAKNAAVKTVVKTTAVKSIQPKSGAADNPKAQAAFDNLKNTVDAIERIALINQFIADFPRSDLKSKAAEMLIVSHVEAGEADFRGGNNGNGIEHFRRAANTFEPAMSDGIFNDIIAKLPFNVFFRAKTAVDRAGALEIAKEIEPKVNGNPARLVALANFYLQTENADTAKRLAVRAAEIAPDSAAAQMTLGMAHRINFHLEAASKAYARAVELDTNSIPAKQNLADTWRGLGQTEDALKLYREMLAADPSNEAAHNGLVLSLFNAGQKDEAEKELAAALTQNPKNLSLQTGAAYWYAVNGDGAKSVALARSAVETEPRYVWGQIALARGLILEKRPLEAEAALLNAKRFGSFPTLDYELAGAHLAAGLFDEAADDLRRSFTLKNGRLETKLAGRSAAQADNFIELLSRERRASIFQPESASGEKESRKLKELLILSSDINDNAADDKIIKEAGEFAADVDELTVHRQLYAANHLLSRKIALPQVLELTQTATANLDDSLNVAAPTAAVLADELYEPRRLAQTGGGVLNVADVPRDTLQQIMRGRVEEIAGWTLFQQDKPHEAAIRLRRAVTILPPSSVWWRSSYWKLGSALEASGKSKEALDAYLRSYKADAPNETRLVIIKALYARVFGTLNGLERSLGEPIAAASADLPQNVETQKTAPPPPAFKNPLPRVIASIVQPTPAATPKLETLKIEMPAREVPASVPAPPEVAATIPTPTPEIKTESASAPAPTPTTITTPEPIISSAVPETIAAPTPNTAVVETTPEAASVAAAAPVSTSAPAVTAPDEDKINSETKPVLETSRETVSENRREKLETANSIIGDALPNSAKTALKAAEPAPSAKDEAVKNPAESQRPRVVIRSINPTPTTTPVDTKKEPKTTGVCSMQFSDLQLSILRNGGAASLMVTMNDAETAEKLTVTASSSNDLSVALQPETSIGSSRRLYLITSISEITRPYTLNVESPCGRQEIKVRVR